MTYYGFPLATNFQRRNPNMRKSVKNVITANAKSEDFRGMAKFDGKFTASCAYVTTPQSPLWVSISESKALELMEFWSMLA